MSMNPARRPEDRVTVPAIADRRTLRRPLLVWLWPVPVGMFLGANFLSPVNGDGGKGMGWGGLIGLAVAIVRRLRKPHTVPVIPPDAGEHFRSDASVRPSSLDDVWPDDRESAGEDLDG